MEKYDTPASSTVKTIFESLKPISTQFAELELRLEALQDYVRKRDMKLFVTEYRLMKLQGIVCHIIKNTPNISITKEDIEKIEEEAIEAFKNEYKEEIE